MPTIPTYPGVYVEEIPSGVRTIVGVGTSTALFIGRTKGGPLNTPTLCLSQTDFERTFSSDATQGDLPRAVNLFYANGGTTAWVMRIAKDANAAGITLRNEAGADVLTVTARSAGAIGNDVRVGVTYNPQDPEGSFNLEVFRWTNVSGQLVKTGREVYMNLSMDPSSPFYAPLAVNGASALIVLTDPLTVLLAATGISRNGRPLLNTAVADVRNTWTAILGQGSTLRISIAGKPYMDVDLSTIVPGTLASDADLATKIQNKINVAGVTVVPFIGPTGPGPATTFYLQIASPDGDVRVIPASLNDIAVPLRFGAAQGGIEITRASAKRPAPTGIVFNPLNTAPSPNLVKFGQLQQDAVKTLQINGTAVTMPSPTPLVMTAAGDPMYYDAGGPAGALDGIREKFGILTGAVNAFANNTPSFAWSASVVGSRLVLTPTGGGDNDVGTIVTDNPTFDSWFNKNARYYNLGTVAVTVPPFATKALAQIAADGTEPLVTDYAAAFLAIDKNVDLFNLMVLPRDASDTTGAHAMIINGPASAFCKKRRAMLLIDAPPGWRSVANAIDTTSGFNAMRTGVVKDTTALFFPRVQVVEGAGTAYTGAAGALAGVMARIDGTRGVWKAPAGTEADIRGITGVEYRFSDDENGQLNPHAINVIRVFPDGIVSWGARTMDGDDNFGSEYKYIPVRRLAYFLEESLYRGLKWVVFEPNDEPLWAQIRLNVGSFMHEQFRKGAFAGTTPAVAYFVKCDKSTTTPADQNLGIVNIVVGFAPLKPAEFVIIQLQQMAGQLAT